jgi:hypothetical protein
MNFFAVCLSACLLGLSVASRPMQANLDNVETEEDTTVQVLLKEMQ